MLVPALLLLSAASAHAQTFTSAGPITLDESNATPYPSPIDVSGVAGTVTEVRARLTDVTTMDQDDLDILLVGPGGQRVMLMSDVFCEVCQPGRDYVFDDGAVASMSDSSEPTSGTWRPTNLNDPSEANETLDEPAPPSPYGSQLAAFAGVDPNGTWKLYVHDDTPPLSEPADAGSIGSWSIELTVAPPEDPPGGDPPPKEDPPGVDPPPKGPGPTLQSAAFSRPPVAGEPTRLVVTFSDPDSPVTGVIVDFGEGGGLMESACVTTLRSTGPFAPGTPVRIAIPWEFGRAGPHTLTVRLLSGGCGAQTVTVVSFAVDVGGSTSARAAGLPLATASASCKRAAAVPQTPKALKAAEKAVLCLMNLERRKNKLKPLVANKKLRAAALGHARAMVAQKYFAHEGPSGPGLAQRLSKVRYRAAAGENLGAGSGIAASPKQLVVGWMNSPVHRANVLEKKWKAVGIGVTKGVPVPMSGPAATYTANFGSKR